VKPRPTPLGYRPELDGLRALAVLAVMLFHANAGWTKGGFLGVDIFFVLSGFLITRLLLEERDFTQHIALARFYLRRVLRLFPALVVVSLACAFYASVWLPHDQVVSTWRDVFSTATYHMNWVQALGTRPPYGLLDHAWSLSIEEQFYVVWPVMLIIAHRIGGVRAVCGVALVGAVASATLRLALLIDGRPFNRLYFGLDTHADGLLIGCALAALTLLWPDLPRHVTGRVSRWLGPLALVGIGVAVATVSLTSRALFAWGYLVFVLVTAVLVADLYARGLTSRLLHHEPLVAIGRISYGLYLWHWPVYLVLNGGRIHWGFIPLTLLRLAVSGLLAVASFLLVEQPFLRLKRRLEPALAGRGRTTAPAGAAAMPAVDVGESAPVDSGDR
jgi:peptidoglycan/LPS O-acetylase OafA/YrhL